jgi:hypothetical protein
VGQADLPEPLVDGDGAVVVIDEGHVGVHQRRLPDACRAGEEDDAAVFVQEPAECDQFRGDAVVLDEVDGRHRLGGLLPDGDVRAVLADGRQRDGTAS